MKKVTLAALPQSPIQTVVIGGPVEHTQTAPPQVPVTHFEPDSPFASGPAAASPLPPPVQDPVDFQEFMALALKARHGSMAHATYWAQLAQAVALAEIADHLEELLEFVGARDGDEETDGGSPVRLFDVLAELQVLKNGKAKK